VALAADYGITHQAISQIRSGRIYAEVYAKLEKQGYRLPGQDKKLCNDCQHWGRYGCSFGFLMPATTLLRIVTYSVPPKGTTLLQ
jgi:hypothetical protein